MRVIETSLGTVQFTGEFDRPERPLALVIRGAFAREDQYAGLALDLPDVDMAFAHLPGWRSPCLSQTSFEAFGVAFDEAAEQVFGERPFAKIGISMGGLVAMAMRRGGPIVALDTPLSTAPMWPIHAGARLAVDRNASLAPWVWALLGVDERGVENRDYRSFVTGALGAPITYLIAGEPLEPERPYEGSPGLISAEDREFLKALPEVRRVWFTGFGHHLAVENGADRLVEEVRRAVEAVRPA